MEQAILDQLLADRAAKRPVVLATHLNSGAQQFLYPREANGDDNPLNASALKALIADKSGTVETDDGEVFLHVFNPPLRMFIIGAVHIAQPLAVMADQAGYQVTVIDPRRAFATAERFPGINLSNEWPDEALADLDLDRRTAVITLTHDPKLDDPALESALNSEAFYIGTLGSTRTHAARLECLKQKGFGDEALSRLHGPVGLDIGAQSPAEIAVSIIAEATQHLRQEEA